MEKKKQKSKEYFSHKNGNRENVIDFSVFYYNHLGHEIHGATPSEITN